MIQANELRIGNWVSFENRFFQIHCISSEFPFLNTDEFGVGVVSWGNITPIPLTPEMLDKLGFEKLPHSFSVERFHITKQDNSDYWWAAFNKNNAYINKIKYLHQLQNLYYALTGTELTITL